ncbi:MATE efflux family protein [Artemisia annua]|uniref:MATE efflux family protein n=1 Tax=Artemisia annua TaxID=35608 RepID=A0A2U1M8X3_ARTAN|nr:MATE efflux family protein [Artemisia annua]
MRPSIRGQKYDMLGVYLQRSSIVLTITPIPITMIYIFSRPILLLLGQSPSVSSAAALFVYRLVPQIFAYTINFPIQKFLQPQSIVAPNMYISAGTLVIHMIMSWIMAYKLNLGLLGASFTLSLPWWIIVAGQFTYTLLSDRCKDTWTGFNSKAFGGLWEFVKLSSGMGVVGLFFMVSVGFNAAARQQIYDFEKYSVRVGNELGAGNPKAAVFSVWMVIGVSFIITVVESIIILSVRDFISYAFTTRETVANEVSDLCPLLVITIILNGIQPVLSGVVLGCGWKTYVAYVKIECYYVVGIPLGFHLGFYFDLGVKGI